MFAESGFWLPLLVGAPLVGLELWYDMRSRGRRLIPELAGAIGIGAVATAIALAGGEGSQVAWGLWVVIAARSLAAVPYVRTQISRTRSKPGPIWHSDLAQLAAVSAVALGSVADLVPRGSAIIIAVLAGINVVTVRTKPRRAVVIGIQQTVLGLTVIATTAIAIHMA